MHQKLPKARARTCDRRGCVGRGPVSLGAVEAQQLDTAAVDEARANERLAEHRVAAAHSGLGRQPRRFGLGGQVLGRVFGWVRTKPSKVNFG